MARQDGAEKEEKAGEAEGQRGKQKRKKRFSTRVGPAGRGSKISVNKRTRRETDHEGNRHQQGYGGEGAQTIVRRGAAAKGKKEQLREIQRQAKGTGTSQEKARGKENASGRITREIQRGRR